MRNNPPVSVLMPAYNTEKYIAEAIDSVLKQNLQVFELIIVDDGSTDGTAEVIKKYQDRDSRIKYFYQPNSGVAAARNRCIAEATGKYLTFLDSDDWWEPVFLEKMLSPLEQDKKVNFVYSFYRSVYPDGRTEYGSAGKKEGRFGVFVHKQTEIRFPFLVGCFIIRHDFLKQSGVVFDRDIYISEDLGWFMKLLSMTEAKCVPEYLLNYRQNDSSLTHKDFLPDKWAGTVKIFGYALPYVQKYYPEIGKEYYHLWNYKAYRFILSLLKKGCFAAAEKYISIFEKQLRCFSEGNGRLNDRLKCRLILLNNRLLWRLMRKI